MSKKLKIEVSSFEALKEDNLGALVGGFSMALSPLSVSMGEDTNNCHGGNCASNCGNGQNVNCTPSCVKPKEE